MNKVNSSWVTVNFNFAGKASVVLLILFFKKSSVSSYFYRSYVDIYAADLYQRSFERSNQVL